MSDIVERTRPGVDVIDRERTDTKPKTERPKMYKVLLVNDDYTPFELVVMVLMAEFKTSEQKAHQIMWTAHKKGVCLVSVYARDIAETKAASAMALAMKHDFALRFSVEPEE